MLGDLSDVVTFYNKHISRTVSIKSGRWNALSPVMSNLCSSINVRCDAQPNQILDKCTFQSNALVLMSWKQSESPESGNHINRMAVVKCN
jgi:hypothetical protein